MSHERQHRQAEAERAWSAVAMMVVRVAALVAGVVAATGPLMSVSVADVALVVGSVVMVVAVVAGMVAGMVAAVAVVVLLLRAADVVVGGMLTAAARRMSEAGAAVGSYSVRVKSVRDARPQSGQCPSFLAERLLLLVLPAGISEPVVGDLAERFPWIQERHGVRFARIWYWRQALGAVCRFLGLRVTGALSLGVVVRVARRLFSL